MISIVEISTRTIVAAFAHRRHEYTYTALYMAPELMPGAQSNNGQRIDLRFCDVFSFGILLHPFATGHMPYEECKFTNINAFYQAVLAGTRPSLAEVHDTYGLDDSDM